MLILTKGYGYLPYGELLSADINTGGDNRTGYIHKEFDDESYLADHGVRKYDKAVGRFITPDAMWEKYYECSLNESIKNDFLMI